MFSIQISLPKKIKSSIKYLDVDDALDKTCGSPNDQVVIGLGDFCLSMLIAYEFADIIDCVLDMVEDVAENTVGNGLYGFAQNSAFDGDWDLIWSDDSLVLSMEWRVCKTAELLRQLPKQMTISRKLFLNEWRTCFDKIVGALIDLSLTHPDQMVRMKHFIATTST